MEKHLGKVKVSCRMRKGKSKYISLIETNTCSALYCYYLCKYLIPEP